MVVFVFAVVALIAGSVMLIFGPVIPEVVQRVQVDGTQTLTAEEVRRIAGLEIGRLYPDKELEQAEERLRLHPLVRDARVERRGSDGLRVIVEERECAAIIHGRVDGREVLFAIGRDLTILAENRVRCGGVPVLRGTFHRDAERFDDPGLRRLLESLDRMRRTYPELAARVSELRVLDGGSGLSLFLSPKRVRVELPPELDDETIRRLYAAVSYYENAQVDSGGTIDLRGDRGVVVPGSAP